MLGTLDLQPPPSLSATLHADGAVDLAWEPSPSASQRDVEYVVLRRSSGEAGFTELARTGGLAFSDAPPPGTHEYAVRSAAATFTSEPSEIVSVTR